MRVESSEVRGGSEEGRAKRDEFKVERNSSWTTLDLLLLTTEHCQSIVTLVYRLTKHSARHLCVHCNQS